MPNKFKTLLKKTAANPIRLSSLAAALFKHALIGTAGSWLITNGLTTEELWQTAVGSVVSFWAFYQSWADVRKVAADESTRALQWLGLARHAVSSLAGVLLAFPVIDATYVNAGVAAALTFIATLASVKAPEKTEEVEEKVWPADVILLLVAAFAASSLLPSCTPLAGNVGTPLEGEEVASATRVEFGTRTVLGFVLFDWVGIGLFLPSKTITELAASAPSPSAK